VAPTGANQVQPGNETRLNILDLLIASAPVNQGFVSLSWERTDLVVRTVFKIAEVVARRLVGSIPTRSRQKLHSTLTNPD
jgi:hypothetical protein